MLPQQINSLQFHEKAPDEGVEPELNVRVTPKSALLAHPLRFAQRSSGGVDITREGTSTKAKALHLPHPVTGQVSVISLLISLVRSVFLMTFNKLRDLDISY